MTTNLVSRRNEERSGDAGAHLDEHFIQKIWLDCDRQVSRAQIRQITAEIAAEFQDATVTTFVPIFIQRRVCEEVANRLGTEPPG